VRRREFHNIEIIDRSISAKSYSKDNKLAIEADSYSQILQSNTYSEENMTKGYAKSLSNTSTTSVDSGIFDIDISSTDKDTSGSTMNIGEAVKKILSDANKDKRVISGVKNSIKFLNETENPEHTLFFFMAPTVDHTSHMSTILLKAFCFENDIYIVQLDSMEKFSRILNIEATSCALVQRSNIVNDVYSNDETVLIDHCEYFWDEVVQPIIRLPEK
jgi:ribosomal protein L7Ae-like RNA K-turn-binding protein